MVVWKNLKYKEPVYVNLVKEKVEKMYRNAQNVKEEKLYKN